MSAGSNVLPPAVSAGSNVFEGGDTEKSFRMVFGISEIKKSKRPPLGAEFFPLGAEFFPLGAEISPLGAEIS